MQIAKKTAEYTIFKRADNRYAVQGKNKAFINGDDKVKILTDEGFLSAPKPKPKTEEPSSEDAATEEAGDTAASDA